MHLQCSMVEKDDLQEYADAQNQKSPSSKQMVDQEAEGKYLQRILDLESLLGLLDEPSYQQTAQ